MGRGRKRKHNPTIPAHIDQALLPAGIYWDRTGSGRWYVLEPHPEGGTRARTVASAAARLSDLHAIIEQRKGKHARGTIGFVIEQFEESTEWTDLSSSTRADYSYCAEIVRGYKTKLGCTFDALQVDRLTTPVIQRLVEDIAKGKAESKPGAGDAIPAYPSKANHLLRYLRRLFAWGVRLGHCTTNPAQGAKEAKERKRFRMPEHDAYRVMLEFARVRGARKAHTKGSSPPYLWRVMEISYLCRMRGIEAVKLTDAHASDDGLHVQRVKGSLDNVVRWNPRLRAAWNSAIALRTEIRERPANRSRPTPIRPDKRFVFVTQSGVPLSRNALKKAWQDLMIAALEEQVITPEQRFTMHGLKHRGITDTKGNRADKRQASGHKTDAMLDVYDHDLPVVDPATAPEFSGEFSGVVKK